MTLISYAQNAEDVVLWRAFAAQGSGFYIDVGAADPRADSVTKLFSDRGWRGINIEPQHEHWVDLERERPLDVNLECGLGAISGVGTFVRNRDIPGWSTFSPEFRARYEASEMTLEVVELELRTLAEVWDAHAPPVVDFLKIDVEGYEREVLLGGDWSRHQPRVVVIEATAPDAWEQIILDAGYHPTLFDGLNRFYVARDHLDLTPALSAPANVLDHYRSWIDADYIAKLETEVAELKSGVGARPDAKPRVSAVPQTPEPSGSPPASLLPGETLPVPPIELIERVGASPDDPVGSYLQIGKSMLEHAQRLLPPDRPLGNARFLDFGCGSGRILRYLVDKPGMTLIGCDIHPESIEWIRHNLPGVTAFVNQEEPGLPLEDRSVDIVWAGSVFTHLDETWSAWLTELHRILDVNGVMIASILASGMSEVIANEPWNEHRIGMNTLMRGNSWDRGGPSVLLSPWWIQEHWGRAFDILSIEPEGFGAHGAVVLRKRDVDVTPEDLERMSHDPREIAALCHNIEQLHAESLRFRRALDGVTSESTATSDGREGLVGELHARDGEIEQLRGELAALRQSRSWRLTRPLRAALGVVRRFKRE